MPPNGKQVAAIGVCCVVCCVIPIIIMIANSFSVCPQNHVGLDYSSVSKLLDTTVYEPGLYFLGLGHRFITFPTTLQTIRYSTSDHDLLHTRTQDGLNLILGVSFQYRYIPSQVHDLYTRYLDQHATVLFLAATNVINEVATNYTAYEYFDDKRRITHDMQEALGVRFRSHYNCEIYALQIRIFELPQQFDAAVQETITTKQNITVTQRYVENVMVTLQTNEIVARKAAQVTVIQAGGDARAVTTSQMAVANQTQIMSSASMEAYGAVKSALAFTEQELLDYVWTDMLATGSAVNNTQLLVGVKPNTFIKAT